MKKLQSTVAFYQTQEQVQDAVKKLEISGFDMKMVSFIGSDFRRIKAVSGYYNIGEAKEKWVSYGALWEGFWLNFHGSAFFVVPLLGPVLIAGPLVAALAGSLGSSAIAGRHEIFSAALISLGMPAAVVNKYEMQIQLGKFMLLMNGTEATIKTVNKLLSISLDEHIRHDDRKIVLSGGERSFPSIDY